MSEEPAPGPPVVPLFAMADLAAFAGRAGGVPVDPTAQASLATLAGQYARRMPESRPAAG